MGHGLGFLNGVGSAIFRFTQNFFSHIGRGVLSIKTRRTKRCSRVIPFTHGFNQVIQILVEKGHRHQSVLAVSSTLSSLATNSLRLVCRFHTHKGDAAEAQPEKVHFSAPFPAPFPQFSGCISTHNGVIH